jgi:hypothetical protein
MQNLLFETQHAEGFEQIKITLVEVVYATGFKDRVDTFKNQM